MGTLYHRRMTPIRDIHGPWSRRHQRAHAQARFSAALFKDPGEDEGSTRLSSSAPTDGIDPSLDDARALDLPDTGTDYFVDDDGSVDEAGINKIAAAGITVGCNPPAGSKSNILRQHSIQAS